jgi:hypothetical protein
MDQLKVFLAEAKKHHFWIICTVVILVSLGSWYMATASVDAETSAFKSTIEGKNSEINGVNKQNPPNQHFIDGMNLLITQHGRDIEKAWDKRYEQQVKLFVWPEKLSAALRQKVEAMKPIESVPLNSLGLLESELDEYRNYITEELPKLANIIGTKWRFNSDGEAASDNARPIGGDGGLIDPRQADKSVVIWGDESQGLILKEHFAFSTRDGRTPTTPQVLYAQEDLWVLQAVMQIIKNTNGSADTNFDASVKEIISLQIGKTVEGRVGKITMLKQDRSDLDVPGGNYSEMAMMAPGATPGMPPPSMTPPGMSPPGMPPVGPGAPGAAPGVVDPNDPAIGRYVDVNYDPLPPPVLRGAATSTDPATAIYSVAKRMPVRLRLAIKQSSLPKFLAECGNYSLPLEVRQLRINCEAGARGDSGGGASSFGYGDGGVESPRMSSSGGGGSSRRRQNPTDPNAPAFDSDEAEIEVYGIIYIMNPVDRKFLGIEAVTPTAPVPGGSTPTAAPVATPPAAVPVTPTPMPPATAPVAPMAPATPPAVEPMASVLPIKDKANLLIENMLGAFSLLHTKGNSV